MVGLWDEKGRWSVGLLVKDYWDAAERSIKYGWVNLVGVPLSTARHSCAAQFPTFGVQALCNWPAE